MFSNIVWSFIFIIIEHKMLQMMLLWKKNDERMRVLFLEMYGTVTSLNICDLVRARYEGSVFQI